MAAVDPDQEAALRRLRAAFGFVEVLRIVDHDDDQDQDDDEEAIEEGEPLPPAGPVVSARRRRATAVHDSLALVRVGPQQLIGGRPAGMLSRGVCHSRYQGPLNHLPQPWIGQPHCSHGSAGSWRPSSVSGWA
jgi:hypothetical protein